MANPEVQETETLPLEDPVDVLLALLYAPGRSGSVAEPVEGRTRIQKLMFLLQQEDGPSTIVEYAKDLPYIAHNMGPYSQDLAETLDELSSAGIVRSERLEYVISDDTDPGSDDADIEAGGSGTKRVESLRFGLSDFGAEIAKRIWDGMSDQQREDLTEFKSFFNSLTLRQLLIFTYDRYPDYTGRSVIKGKLGLKG